MSYDNSADELSPDTNDDHAGSGGPGDEPRPSNTLSIEIPKRDVVDNDSSGEDGEGGDGEAVDEDDNLSDSEQRRREDAGLNSPTGQTANESAGASYASAVADDGEADGRDERGPRSPRRISKNAQVSWMADEQKQAGGAVTQADEAPPAALAAMLTQVDKPGTGGGGGNPITSVPRDQPTTTTTARQESDNTDSEIRRVSQQRGSWLACCSWLNCSSQVEQVDDEEPTVVGGASVDIGTHAQSRPVKTYTSGEPGGPRGISDECDGGFEPSVDYPDPYYEDGLLPRPIEQHKRQKCLVLDLDETLVHSSFKPVPNADFIIPVEIDGVIHRVYVMKRPYVDEFLARCARKYEIVVFTASLAKYANPLLDQLDPNGTVTYRLFRESCVIHQTAYVKDLTRLARPISKTIIVDNSAQSYLFQPKNAIPIPSWFDDMTDTMLMDLLPVLETTMWEIPDVRKLLDAHTKSYRWLCNQANKTPEFS